MVHSRNRRVTTDNSKRSLIDTLLDDLAVNPLNELTDSLRRDPSPDRRYWNPDRVRAENENPFRPTYHPISTRTTRIDKTTGEVHTYHTYDYKNPVHWVQDPRETMVCARRAIRTEVLHAMKKTGRGGGKRKPPKRNADSLIKCRR